MNTYDVLTSWRKVPEHRQPWHGLISPEIFRSLPLHWRHNDHDGVSNHQPHDCLLNRLFRRRLKKTSKLRVTGLCVGNSPGPVNSPHKGPVTRKMFPFDGVIMTPLVLCEMWPRYWRLTIRIRTRVLCGACVPTVHSNALQQNWVTSHKGHGVSNHRQSDCSFSFLVWLTLKKKGKSRVMEFPHKTLSCHDVIMPSPPSAAYMRQWIGSALVQIMACRLSGTKPVFKPMLSYSELDH